MASGVFGLTAFDLCADMPVHCEVVIHHVVCVQLGVLREVPALPMHQRLIPDQKPKKFPGFVMRGLRISGHLLKGVVQRMEFPTPRIRRITRYPSSRELRVSVKVLSNLVSDEILHVRIIISEYA